MPVWVAAMISSRPFSPRRGEAAMSPASTDLNGSRVLPFRDAAAPAPSRGRSRRRTGSRSAARSTACRRCRTSRCARSTGTKSAPPAAVVRETKSRIAFLGAPSFQDGSGIGLRERACAAAQEAGGRPENKEPAPKHAYSPSMTRRLYRPPGKSRVNLCDGREHDLHSSSRDMRSGPGPAGPDREPLSCRLRGGHTVRSGSGPAPR